MISQNTGRGGEGDGEGNKGSKEGVNRWIIIVANYSLSPLETLLDMYHRKGIYAPITIPHRTRVPEG